jgi:hypothetical protein
MTSDERDSDRERHEQPAPSAGDEDLVPGEVVARAKAVFRVRVPMKPPDQHSPSGEDVERS